MSTAEAPELSRPKLTAREKLAVATRGALLLVLMLYVAYSVAGGHQTMLETGAPAPEAHLTSYDGKHWTLDRFKGKPMVVNFWAPWCPPCLSELPELVKVSKERADQVVFVGLVVDSPPADVFAVIRKMGIPYPVAAADGATVAAWQATSIPATYLLDANHRVVWAARGQVSEKQLNQALDAYLVEPGVQPE